MTHRIRSNIPAEVSTAVSAYLDLVDSRLPGRIDGLYLTGSVALDDYRPGHSDVDFVAVTGTTWSRQELAQLGQVHRDFRRAVSRPMLDGVYVTWRELQTSPENLSVPFCLDSRFVPRGGFAANPVTWFTLDRYPVSMRGPAKPAVASDENLLRTWCRENLLGYWARWVHTARTHPIRWLFSLSRQAVVWGVLGVTRLHATIRTGDIISKSVAGVYALETFSPHWSPVIKEALGIRLGAPAHAYHNIFARRRDMLAFMEHVISDDVHT